MYFTLYFLKKPVLTKPLGACQRPLTTHKWLRWDEHLRAVPNVFGGANIYAQPQDVTVLASEQIGTFQTFLSKKGLDPSINKSDPVLWLIIDKHSVT
ncbi:hypothetical protein J2Z83_002373 [Virgibacillus natechei]|uniref:Uncharacterized protein n=1 Tax=Virgibacillus natechei TaxID=1216297 RepID=A0ABS4IH27_9BACI|nr:hypothetical protein [Virgibacillus natechei]